MPEKALSSGGPGEGAICNQVDCSRTLPVRGSLPLDDGSQSVPHKKNRTIMQKNNGSNLNTYFTELA